MGKSTISMAIFNSKLLVYQRVNLPQTAPPSSPSTLAPLQPRPHQIPHRLASLQQSPAWHCNFTKRGDKTHSKQRGKFIRSNNNAQQQKAILIVWNLGDPSLAGSICESSKGRVKYREETIIKIESSTLVVSSCLSFFPNISYKWIDLTQNLVIWCTIYIYNYILYIHRDLHRLICITFHGLLANILPLSYAAPQENWPSTWVGNSPGSLVNSEMISKWMWKSPKPFNYIGLDPSWSGVSCVSDYWIIYLP